MSNRRPFVGGNWKMNGDLARSAELADDLAAAIGSLAETVDVAVYPPSPYLQAVGHALRGADIQLGGQDCSPHLEGAYTGQTSPLMIGDLGGRSVLVGHSERRHGLAEADELLAAKVRAALAADLSPVLCVGETQEERDAGLARETVARQVRDGFADLEAGLAERLVIAYEPVWAIGTGVTATPSDAQEAHAAIRSLLASLYDAELADGTRIIYGGSVKASNALELFSEPDIDGGLIGGASLVLDDFLAICRAADATCRS
ncbi:MAG: triose-phosphate isomerase [Planctomycetota bacterium]|nr:triose-phosphate isomerase [Planctomycetota bacterium]MEE2895798.1 triose-phosphate isomerase [Planctomycetota bacterium]